MKGNGFGGGPSLAQNNISKQKHEDLNKFCEWDGSDPRNNITIMLSLQNLTTKPIRLTNTLAIFK